MKYFTVIYQMPLEALKAWMEKPKEERAEPETKLMNEWNAWMEAHKDQVLNTISFGTAKVVSADGVVDESNGMMMSSYVQAESLEAAAELFKSQPHLSMPGATMIIMEATEMKPKA